MLGGLRFVLALLVVVTHLSGAPAWGHLGGFAVFGFYLLSGYLMTMVLHEVYDFRFAAFAANRALRLFPVYFVVAGATLLLILPLQPEATAYHYAYGIRTGHWDLAGNLLLAPFELYDRKFRLVPPTWSVGVEIINYALLWLFVARRPAWALGTFVCAVAYHLIALGLGSGLWYRYQPFYAAVLPFSLGALVYFSQPQIRRVGDRTARLTAGVACSAWVGGLIACGILGSHASASFDLFYYFNLVALAGLVAALTHPAWSGQFAVAGKFLGDLAYPIFLVHWLIGFIVVLALPEGPVRGWHVLINALPGILLAAWALVKFTNAVVEPARNAIRAGRIYSAEPRPAHVT